MATQAHTTHWKARWSRPPPRPSAGTHAQPYRGRRPETTSLHRIVREHLEAYLALANEDDPMGDGVPDHVEKEFRSYLRCGILAHGFARARCSGCGYDFLVALACYSCCASSARAAIGAGRFQGSWGRRGEGPREFPVLQGLFACADDRIAAFDRSRLHLFSGSGELIQTFQLLPPLVGYLGERVIGIGSDCSSVVSM